MLKFKRILVATDFSRSARVALRSGQALATGAGGTLELVHVVEPLPFPHRLIVEGLEGSELQKLWVREARKKLARTLSRIRVRDGAVRGSVRAGRPWKEILDAARKARAEVICLGNSGRSRFERLLLGSTAESVLRHSAVPVLVTRSRPLGRLRRVLVPVDFEEGSRSALRFALARSSAGTRLEALFVLPLVSLLDPSVAATVADSKEMARELRAFLDEAGARRVTSSVHLLGEPAAEILRHARRRRQDLILLSTHGRRGLARAFLGSVAEKVVRRADRPVLVLPGPGRAAESRVRVRGPVGDTTVQAPKPSRRPESARRRAGRERGWNAAIEERDSLFRARHVLKPRGAWASQAQPGRGGPAGRRGSGQARGTRKSS
jgi:nucleotide-binding universal stress UspA family protein